MPDREAAVRRGVGVVIGVGNPFRRDDGVGHVVADRVAAALAHRCRVPVGAGRDAGHEVRVLQLDGEPTRVVDAWAGAGLAVVVDAVRSGTPPGSIRRIDVDTNGARGPRLAARGGSASTHGSGIADAIALGRVLDRMPDRLVVVLIEGADFGAGPGLSTAVAAAVREAVSTVLAELGR